MTDGRARPHRVRRAAGVIGAIALGYLVLQITGTAIRVLVWRSHWPPALAALARYNKVVTNRPAALKRAGKMVTLVHHTGRTSQRPYVTPVWAERSGRYFFIQLPYGSDADWCRNVVAHGGCGLERDGVLYDVVAPVIVPASEAAPHLPPFARRMHRLSDIRSYLRLELAPDAAG